MKLNVLASHIKMNFTIAGLYFPVFRFPGYEKRNDWRYGFSEDAQFLSLSEQKKNYYLELCRSHLIKCCGSVFYYFRIVVAVL